MDFVVGFLRILGPVMMARSMVEVGAYIVG